MNITMIGCGGVASYLIAPLIKLITKWEPKPLLYLWDGDTLEDRNLDRQLFSQDQIGHNKAEALYQNVGYDGDIQYIAEYFRDGSPCEPGSLLIVCVDNHAARRAALATADRENCPVIVAANEYTSASAYIYWPKWKGGPLDPRVRWPEILTDESDDPTRPAGCQGVATVMSPQLAIANNSAANFALWLIYFWFVSRLEMDKSTEPYWPVEHNNSFTRFNTVLVKDLTPKQ